MSDVLVKEDLGLGQEYVESYKKNGYVVVRDIFTDEEADHFNACMRRHANKDFAAIINPDRYEELYTQDERVKSDVTIEEIKHTAETARRILKNSKVASILRTLQNSDVVGLSSQFIFKEALSRYSSQAWRPHQDNYYPKNKNAAYITMNWFLRETNVENGTIYCYPGTHKLGLLPAADQVSFREEVGQQPGSECAIPEEFKDKRVDIIIPKNSIVFLHGNCIHGSYPNNSERSRPWYSCCYINKGEDFVVGNNSKRENIELG